LFIGFHLPVHGKYGGASWSFLENDEEGTWFYSEDNMGRSPHGIITIRTAMIYSQTGVLKAVEKYGEKYRNVDRAISTWEIDCSRKKFRLLSAIFYSKDKSIIECYDDEEAKYYILEDIPPGSYLELLNKKICR
jgi:hypothetical protein